ncbi:unnamed protein product [Cylindrotheca closterium]|uniref:1,4-dihydroxy-2-naphthoate polyprenyltransferase n=1 Tax=Cylindrotheca closterium TaxID=2856 RepID=A0AAD2CGY7_9STRA|nr:unnamed protein product [Cylindrotheca closterium]
MSPQPTAVSKRPPLWKVWLVASRPHTLTASLSPVLVGYSVGLATIKNVERASYLWLNCKWALFCMLIQLGTNLHNDYADFVKGADTDKRVGQARATQKGWLTPFQTAAAASGVLGLALLLGLGFISSVSGDPNHHVIMIGIVATSIFNAFAYTGGPWPLGYIGLSDLSIAYLGLGDIFVFLYFGLVATITPVFLYTANHDVDQLSTVMFRLLPYAIQVASLATNIIVVNNLRDRHTDISANKNTVAVRFGASFCRTEYSIMVAIAYLLVIYDWGIHSYSAARLFPLLSFRVARKELVAIYNKDGAALNPHVGGTAKVQFLFSVMLSLAMRIAMKLGK